MKNLELNQMQSHSYNESSQSYGDSSSSVVNAIYGADYLALAECAQSQVGEMFGYAGVATRGFSWADDSFSSDIHSANFAGMNASAVIAAGSWSSPSKDFATIFGLDGHAVPSFDVLNIAPADRVFLDGVRNGYALVEEKNFGFVNNEIDNSGYEGRPNRCDETAFPATREPGLNIETEYQYENYRRTDGTALRSEEFNVASSEALIVGHKSMVAQESGDSRE